MELRTYWSVVVRRGWLIAGVFALALAASIGGFALVPQAISYQASLSLAVRPLPEPKTGVYYSFDEYYAYLSSEYLNDDVIELVQGTTFMKDLQNRLASRYPVPPSGSIKAKKAHRVLSITVTSGTADGALALAQAAAEALSPDSESGKRYFEQLTAKDLLVTTVDPPTIVAGPGARSVLDLALRAILGLMAGLALAFVVDYLDESLHDPEEVERLLGVPILGTIPREPKRNAPRARAVVAGREA